MESQRSTRRVRRLLTSDMKAFSGYRAYGLNIASTLRIPGAADGEFALADADIVISTGDAALANPDSSIAPYCRKEQALLFDAAGVARYLAASPSTLVVQIYQGADEGRVQALLAATALPMLLWMRGGIVLHSAGVIPARRNAAIGIAGPSGIGKSTLARRLLADGGRIVGDDTLWLPPPEGKTMVCGMSGSLLLADSVGGPRLEVEVAPRARVEEARLAALFILTPAGAAAAEGPMLLRGSDAVEAFLRNRHRPKIPAILGQEAALLPQCLLHCQSFPIYQIPMKTGDIAGSHRAIASILSNEIGVE